MFAKPSRVALGAALFAPVVVTIGAPSAQAAPPTEKSQCIVYAMSAARLSAGGQSTMVCFATQTEVKAAISGGASAVTAGPTTNAIGQGTFALALYYSSRAGDPNQPTLTMVGSSCSDALYYTPDSWLQYMNAWRPLGCSRAKHFTGANFTGSSMLNQPPQSFVPFDAPFAGNVRSIKFS